MYVLISALGVSKAQGSRWGSLNIGEVLVSQLFANYRKVYATLSNIYLDEPISIDLESLRNDHSFFVGTFNQLLTSLGTTTLTQTTIPPVLNPKYAIYSDAFRAGYKVEPVNVLTSHTANLPPSDKTSLRIIRTDPVTDMELFFKHCLVTVNGFFHQTDFDGEFAYAIDANNSKLKSHQNQIGFLSFLNIGQIESVPITEQMIYKQADESTLSKRTYIKLNKDITNKTVLLVLGGYLLFPDNKSIIQSGEDVFSIDIGKMPFVERYFEGAKYLNYDRLGLPVSDNNIEATNLNDLMSDEVLTKYFTMPQSFFVIVDTPALFTNKVPIKSTGLPGMFIGYKEPIYPLIVSNGRVAEYWKEHEDGQWAVNVYDSYLHNKVLSTIPVAKLTTFSDADVPERTIRNSSGYLLEIGKEF